MDIDIKLRSCKGSCASYTEYSVDRDSYLSLDKQLSQLEAMAVQTTESVTTLRVMKSATVKSVTVPSVYKSGAVEGQKQSQDYFSGVDQRMITLEGMETGSSSIVSKEAGTGRQTSAATGSTSNVHTSTHSVSCTRTIRKETIMTKDGPVEKTVVIGGGPECEGLDALGFGDSSSQGKEGTGTVHMPEFGTFFEEPSKDKSLTSLSQGGVGSDYFKFSSSSTKTVKGGSLKDVFPDFGGFTGGEVEEDRPDIHARSLKTRTETMQRDYVGKGTPA